MIRVLIGNAPQFVREQVRDLYRKDQIEGPLWKVYETACYDVTARTVEIGGKTFEIVDPTVRYRLVDTWNGGTGGRVILFTSTAVGADGHNECFEWVHRNKPYSFHAATTEQGLVCEPVDEPLLSRTKIALEAYDADQARRDKLSNDIVTDDDVAEWERNEAMALDEVRRAFHEDTSDRNSWSQAKVIDLATLRQWVARDLKR